MTHIEAENKRWTNSRRNIPTNVLCDACSYGKLLLRRVMVAATRYEL